MALEPASLSAWFILTLNLVLEGRGGEGVERNDKTEHLQCILCVVIILTHTCRYVPPLGDTQGEDSVHAKGSKGHHGKGRTKPIGLRRKRHSRVYA